MDNSLSVHGLLISNIFPVCLFCSIFRIYDSDSPATYGRAHRETADTAIREALQDDNQCDRSGQPFMDRADAVLLPTAAGPDALQH